MKKEKKDTLLAIFIVIAGITGIAGSLHGMVIAPMAIVFSLLSVLMTYRRSNGY